MYSDHWCFFFPPNKTQKKGFFGLKMPESAIESFRIVPLNDMFFGTEKTQCKMNNAKHWVWVRLANT